MVRIFRSYALHFFLLHRWVAIDTTAAGPPCSGVPGFFLTSQIHMPTAFSSKNIRRQHDDTVRLYSVNMKYRSLIPQRFQGTHPSLLWNIRSVLPCRQKFLFVKSEECPALGRPGAASETHDYTFRWTQHPRTPIAFIWGHFVRRFHYKDTAKTWVFPPSHAHRKRLCGSPQCPGTRLVCAFCTLSTKKRFYLTHLTESS